jgi:hypothetical protein
MKHSQKLDNRPEMIIIVDELTVKHSKGAYKWHYYWDTMLEARRSKQH